LWGVGMAVGAWISQRSKRRESELFRVALGGSGVILIFMGVFPASWIALLIAVGFGTGLSIAMVLGITIAQRTAPPEMRGRVMSAIHVLARIFLILGAVIVGGIAATFDRVHLPFVLHGWDGNRYAFVVAGIALVFGGLAAKTGAAILENGTAETKDETTNAPEAP